MLISGMVSSWVPGLSAAPESEEAGSVGLTSGLSSVSSSGSASVGRFGNLPLIYID
jgi:hypothetical protein